MEIGRLTPVDQDMSGSNKRMATQRHTGKQTFALDDNRRRVQACISHGLNALHARAL
jgi:hypothetical protein